MLGADTQLKLKLQFGSSARNCAGPDFRNLGLWEAVTDVLIT